MKKLDKSDEDYQQLLEYWRSFTGHCKTAKNPKDVNDDFLGRYKKSLSWLKKHGSAGGEEHQQACVFAVADCISRGLMSLDERGLWDWGYREVVVKDRTNYKVFMSELETRQKGQLIGRLGGVIDRLEMLRITEKLVAYARVKSLETESALTEADLVTLHSEVLTKASSPKEVAMTVVGSETQGAESAKNEEAAHRSKKEAPAKSKKIHQELEEKSGVIDTFMEKITQQLSFIHRPQAKAAESKETSPIQEIKDPHVRHMGEQLSTMLFGLFYNAHHHGGLVEHYKNKTVPQGVPEDVWGMARMADTMQALLICPRLEPEIKPIMSAWWKFINGHNTAPKEYNKTAAHLWKWLAIKPEFQTASTEHEALWKPIPLLLKVRLAISAPVDHVVEPLWIESLQKKIKELKKETPEACQHLASEIWLSFNISKINRIELAYDSAEEAFESMKLEWDKMAYRGRLSERLKEGLHSEHAAWARPVVEPWLKHASAYGKSQNAKNRWDQLMEELWIVKQAEDLNLLIPTPLKTEEGTGSLTSDMPQKNTALRI